jgi:H+/Cl- antiporter ClcA
MASVAPETAVRASEPTADAAPPLIAEGPRAPVWAMIMLLLALVAIAMVQWERRWAARSRRFSTSAAIQAAAQLPRRAALLLSARPGDLYLLLLMSTLAGFFGALVTVVFREGIDALEWLISAQEHGLVAAAESLAGWQRLILPALGGLVAGLILQQIGGLLRGRSTTDYMEAVSTGDGWISVRHSLVKATSSLVTVGSGGSIGREGAMVQLAAMVASVMGRISRFPRDRLRLLVAAGAAAGLAAAYNAPIAATLFVAEIVLGSIALQHIGPLIVAAVIANTTVHDLLGYAPVYDIPAFKLVSDWELALYLVLGVLAGHLGPVFLSLLERAHQFFGRLPLPLAGRMALGGLIVGAISVYEPQVWGNGYSVVNAVLHDPWAWQALLTVLVLKMIATAATHGSGAVGGAFTPTIFVGAMLGALFGTVVNAVFPDGTAPPNAYAVVGMGAMLAGTTHAPLMSILMVFELTLDYRIVLPLMLAVVTAHYVARSYTGVRPMYAESLLPREKPT